MCRSKNWSGGLLFNKNNKHCIVFLVVVALFPSFWNTLLADTNIQLCIHTSQVIKSKLSTLNNWRRCYGIENVLVALRQVGLLS